MSGASGISPRSRRNGVRPRAARTATARRSSCSGAQFGNVFVGVQPGFGYEGDPMRLLFERGFAPTHAFSAFYRYLREDFRADAVLHFGTHGALEFMPGKQTGLSDACWPERLIGAAAERLPLRRQQPLRGHARQAPLGRDPGELPDPEPRPGRALSRPHRPQGLDRALARPGAGGGRRAPRPRRADPGPGRRPRPRAPPSRPGTRTSPAQVHGARRRRSTNSSTP